MNEKLLEQSIALLEKLISDNSLIWGKIVGRPKFVYERITLISQKGPFRFIIRRVKSDSKRPLSYEFEIEYSGKQIFRYWPLANKKEEILLDPYFTTLHDRVEDPAKIKYALPENSVYLLKNIISNWGQSLLFNQNGDYHI